MVDYWERHIIVLGAEEIRPLKPNGPTIIVTGLWFTAEEYAAHNYDDIWHKEAQVGLKMDEYENISIVSAPVTPTGVGFRILD
jgi:hypothetical protein